MKMIQLTNFRDSESLIKSQYGSISYLEWNLREKERITRNPTRKAEIKMRDTDVALFVNEI